MIKRNALKSMMITTFSRWGMPQRIKIDNGYPFQAIRSKELPSLSMLWWVGLGITPTLNDLASPQQNGTVEGLQRITARWANPGKCRDMETLQTVLNEVARRQRTIYRIRAKGDKTREELYPALEQNPRKYHEVSFDMERVKAYLAKFVFIRKAGKNRHISLAGFKINIGTKHKSHKVSVTYNPKTEKWEIRTEKGELIKESKHPEVSKTKILNFIPLSKKL